MKTEISPITAPPPEPVYLKNYRPPAFRIETLSLDVTLHPTQTRVRAGLRVTRLAPGPLVLNGEDLILQSVHLDGEAVPPDAYHVDDISLTLDQAIEGKPHFTLETVVEINPAANTRLSGLYMSNGMFCTQCEAEGFRRVTYYPDRPDVLSVFDVRIEADKSTCPILLANGNEVGRGDLGTGRHFVRWHDPHPKPAYLFALVGGDLACIEDRFTTASGREVALRVFVEAANADKCAYTLDALKRAMRWDEEAFGREYDLDIFMIVAVDHFNFGAMENKGLNIFNAACVLASPQTATDTDYELIESVVAHEYFHNWSGNRVTCRDWFQLCLKEGFTVFRDQEFSAAMRDPDVQRIRDVRRLWQAQFPEDAGPLAHPVRPAGYISIDNFYTATVYEKGAELVRMIRALLGPAVFRKGTDLYFDRQDGCAATVEDFVACMEEAGGQRLTQFMRWYDDAGTPRLAIEESFEAGCYRLRITQQTAPTPGQPDKAPRQIPFPYGLLSPDGREIAAQTRILTQGSEEIEIPGLDARPVASVGRGFCAPVIVDMDQSVTDRLLLIRHDTDPFNRWSAAYHLGVDILLALAGENRLEQNRPDGNRSSEDRMTEDRVSDGQGAATEIALQDYGEALRALVTDKTLSPAFRAEILKVPSLAEMALKARLIDPAKLEAARQNYRIALARQLHDDLTGLYTQHEISGPYDMGAIQAGERALRNGALSLLLALEGEKAGDAAVGLALQQAGAARNMTDEAAAVMGLAFSGRPERAAVLNDFYEKWQAEPLVVNKWLAWQAGAPGGLEAVQRLVAHEAYDERTPNKVRALLGTFVTQNLPQFHQADGAGYAFFFDHLIRLDRLNPQVAARLLTACESWRRLEPVRQSRLEGHLRRLVGGSGYSDNLYEIAKRLVA